MKGRTNKARKSVAAILDQLQMPQFAACRICFRRRDDDFAATQHTQISTGSTGDDDIVRGDAIGEADVPRCVDRQSSAGQRQRPGCFDS